MFDFEGGTPEKPGLMDNEGEKPPSPIKVEEKLTHPERKSEAYPDVPFFGSDSNELIGHDLATGLKKKTFLLTVNISQLPEEKARKAYGQVGFVRREDENGNVIDVRSVTSLHNIVFMRSEYRFVSCSFSLQADDYYLHFPDTSKVKEDLTPYPLRPSAEETLHDDDWECGVDGAWGSVPRAVQRQHHSFLMIRDGFLPRKGMKIGMAVVLPPRDALYSSFRKEYPNVDINKLNEVYGVCDDRIANVYVGTITYVGESHIEYDNNSFEGCSGAIVLLLSHGDAEPETVLDTDLGCAIAVHGGAHPHQNRNLGFLLSKLN